METYIIKYGNQYLKFGSHKTAIEYDNILMASLYSSERLAKRRLSNIYINRIKVLASKLKIVKVKLTIVSEKVL